MKRQIGLQVMNSSVGPMFRKLHSTRTYRIGRIRTWVYFGWQYRAPLDPFRIIDVDVDDIEYMFDKEEFFSHPNYTSEVKGGDWKQYTTEFAAYDLFQGFLDHFEHGVPWSETSFCQRVSEEAIRDDWEKWGCTNMDEFRASLREYDRLYERIKEDGYKSQKQLQQAGQRGQFGPFPSLANPPEMYEITVVIGRGGQIMFHHQGRHRLAIAKVLDLETIPVRVRARHREWQEIRDTVATGDNSIAYDTSHPDLRYL